MHLTERKILLIVNDMSWFWSHRLPLAKEILRRGWKLHLATNDAKNNPQILELGITGHNLPLHKSSFNPFNQLVLAIRIFHVLNTVKPDIVHAITLRHAFLTGFSARILRTPRAIFTLAGLGPLFLGDDSKVKMIRTIIVPLFKFAFGGRGRFAIFQNPDDAQIFVNSGAIQHESYSVIRGSGVDLFQFSYTPEPSNRVPVILFAARLLKAKGILEYVEAARILRSKCIKARFQVAGDIYPGNFDSISRQQLDEWINEGTIEWLGQRSDMPEVMAAANIVTLPSYYGEGVPKVLLEAAATGRAIVTTDMPGCRETVEDGQTGILVKARNARALADALEKLVADATLRSDMGRNGRARVEKHFAIEMVNSKTLAIYERLLTTA